jgi:tRNA 2-selenouridine synthase
VVNALFQETNVTEVVPFSPQLLDSHLVVDVRTPLEYAEDHLPGAVNVPLLSNDERVEIGTLYKQQGPQPARVRGLELTARRFPAMVAEIASLAGGRPILVYCWRGGLRSLTVVSILQLTGYDAVQLIGGYKAYRHVVEEYFAAFTPTAPLIVIHGMTGTGKTEFILRLDPAHFTVIDLEGLACHRGSAFGSLGLSQELSQKRFDTQLWDAFRRAPTDRPIVLEGESRRIGRINLPGTLYDVMRESVKVWAHASLETRVGRLIAEYALPEYRQGMAEALERIRPKLGGERYQEILGYLDCWDMPRFMEGLIVHYYDKLYYRTRDWTEELTLSLEDYDNAAKELASFATRLR